jgi:hypothetical protein
MIKTQRYYLIDIVKFLTLIAIMVLHTNEFIFYEDHFPLGWNAPFYQSVLMIEARPFSLGGQILVGLVFFLFGLFPKPRRIYLFIVCFALVGQMLLAAIFGIIEWDIYSYIAACCLTLAVVNEKYFKPWPLLVFSFLLLCIPTSFFQQFFPDSIFWDAVTGRLTRINSGSWPPLPWYFLFILTFGLGVHGRNTNKLRTLHPWEYYFWPLFFFMGIPFIGDQYDVFIGRRFYQFVFNLDPRSFWFNYGIFIFFIRVAFLDRVQEFFHRHPSCQFLSQLSWTKHVGLIYVLSVIYVGFGSNFEAFFRSHPLIFDAFFISIFFVCEFAARLVLWGQFKLRERGLKSIPENL